MGQGPGGCTVFKGPEGQHSIRALSEGAVRGGEERQRAGTAPPCLMHLSWEQQAVWPFAVPLSRPAGAGAGQTGCAHTTPVRSFTHPLNPAFPYEKVQPSDCFMAFYIAPRTPKP